MISPEKQSIEQAKSIVKSAVRIAIQNGALTDQAILTTQQIPQEVQLILKHFSTEPSKGDIPMLPFGLGEYCYIVSDMLAKKLEENKDFMKASNNSLTIANSGKIPQLLPQDDPEIFRYHHYLSTVMNGVEIIIDPTINQYLPGYNQIFIGTREELKALVIKHYNEGKFTNMRGYTPEEHFNLVWGKHPFPSKRIDYTSTQRRG